jgi:hypothetical protein
VTGYLRVVLGVVVAALVLAGCSTPPEPSPSSQSSADGPPDVAAVCGRVAAGPTAAPPGAVAVDPASDLDLYRKTQANPPGTVFWLAPGRHTLGSDQYGQVVPKDGNTYIGAPGAVLDGRGLNNFAFTGKARNVSVRNLTVRGFDAPADQGVVNHDSGDGWVVQDNTIEDNKGAGLMAGAHQQVRGNCLRDNGQYGMNAFQPENAITGLVVESNEIVGNNTDDWEHKVEGCGCTGGIKFWSVNGADVRNNWVHDNHGPGLWADTNNNDFLIEDNLIEGNEGEALFYETSYNLVMRDNVLRRNDLKAGRESADKGDNFPNAAVYLSESGGEPRVPARTDKIEITRNAFEGNWSGITAWENADRFCNSAANTSTDSCTRLVASPSRCVQPAIASKPLYDDCRWKTQRVDIHDNTFTALPADQGCVPDRSNRMAVLSNFGTFPDWSPYKGTVVQEAIVGQQGVAWHDNTYVGKWSFMVGNVGRQVDQTAWTAQPTRQDAGSSFSSDPGSPGC